MGVIRQQRSRFLAYLLPGHAASRSLDRAGRGNSRQAQLQTLWQQAPAAKALLRSIETFANTPDGSLLVPPDKVTTEHQQMIFELANRYRLLAVYPYRFRKLVRSTK